jgi:hypothetical protein
MAMLVVLAPCGVCAQEVRGVIHERVVGLVNPLGAEHMLQGGLRVPVGDPHELLFTNAHFEVGASNYTSPIYTMTGGYLQLSPLAFLVLRAEITGVAMWPIGMDGGGHYPVNGYDAPLGANDLPAHLARDAHGWNAQLSAIVQGALS